MNVDHWRDDFLSRLKFYARADEDWLRHDVIQVHNGRAPHRLHERALTPADRVERLRSALFFSGPQARRLMMERLSGIDLSGIWPVLLQTCEDIALCWGGCVVVGGLVGAGIGAFFGGVGAVPGAAFGAAAGAKTGAWVLTALGLKSLIEHFHLSLPQALQHYEHGFKTAWGPKPGEFVWNVWNDEDDATFDAAHDFAEGHVLLILALLSAMVAYLTRGRGQRLAMLQEIRHSPRLGPKVADWVAMNEERLVKHPALQAPQPRQAAPTPRSGPPPMTPSQLRRARELEAQEALKPALPARMAVKKVPCFHPFDKKKFMQLSPQEQKGYLKEMAGQLQRQQDAINSLTAVEYKAARDAFKSVGRNPLADGAQAAARERFADKIQESIKESLQRGGMSVVKADAQAAARTDQVMSRLAALHEPDMVAGGWMYPNPNGMGRSDVNSSIGSSWNQGRVSTMDSAADEAIKSGKGNETMNVKLEPCRGKGMR